MEEVNTKIITVADAVSFLKYNASRGCMMEGAGCITYFVPKKVVKTFKNKVEKALPAEVSLAVYPLNVTCKKGIYETWVLSAGKEIPDMICKSFKIKRKKELFKK